MATPAHCAYCFETLSANLEKRQPLSLRQVETFWSQHHSPSSGPTNPAPTHPTPASPPAHLVPAAISRLLAPSPTSTISSSENSGTSTPSGSSGTSSAVSKNSSRTSFATTQDEHARMESEVEAEAHPLFVTWNTMSGRRAEKRLRGCIGTFEALELEEGLRSYALTSAFDDTRFSPITSRELPTLSCAVTLLTDFEPASSPMDWTIGTHGLRISFVYHGRRHGATYLPDVAREQEWTKEETLVSLMRKAGWSGRKEEWRKVELGVVRYQGKKVEVGYAEWRAWRDRVKEGAGKEGEKE